MDLDDLHDRAEAITARLLKKLSTDAAESTILKLFVFKKVCEDFCQHHRDSDSCAVVARNLSFILTEEILKEYEDMRKKSYD